MPTRRAQRGIVHGIARSFVSRNNDYRGYWALGMLRSYAVEQGLDEVVIQLKPARESSGSPLLAYLEDRYRAMLDRLLLSAGLPLDAVLNAVVRVGFTVPDAIAAKVPRSTWGEPVAVEVLLTDDLNKMRSHSAYTRCGAHNPIREQKRASESRGQTQRLSGRMDDGVEFVLLPGLDGSGSLFAPLIAACPESCSCLAIAYPETAMPLSPPRSDRPCLPIADVAETQRLGPPGLFGDAYILRTGRPRQGEVPMRTALLAIPRYLIDY